MLIIFPMSSDVPVYHWPFGTAGMIVLNIVIFVLQCFFPEATDWFAIHYGEINPITWFTSACMHDRYRHLIGNMMVLAICGWVIEGKVGWWRFILIYFTIAGVGGAAGQLVMFFFEGSSLGASGVMFGLLAIAMIWAPENQVKIGYGGLFFFRPYYGGFDVSIAMLGFILIGFEFVSILFSHVLHVFGVVPGALIGYMMIRYRQVDCDGYDAISIFTGNRGNRVLTVEQEKEREIEIAEEKSAEREKLESGLAMVERYISKGHHDLAISRFQMLKKKNHAMVMEESQLVRIIQAFDSDEKTKPKTVALIRTYLEHYTRLKIPMTLMLARVLVLINGRPKQGLLALKTLDWRELDATQKSFSRKLVERAQKMIADGVLEVDDD